MLLCVVVCCRELQRVTVRRNGFDTLAVPVLQCVAVWCIVSQCVVECCSVLQCDAACYSALQHVAVRCNVSKEPKGTAPVGCSELQCVAACCKHVAVCCSVLQRVAA